jgi:hypothetical protein
METFIAWIQHIPKNQRACVLDTILIGVPTFWWDANRDPYHEWEVVKESMQERLRLGMDIC